MHPIDRLIAIMARLRDPEDGCPWDLEQTFRTILPYTLEEAYEVAEAIERVHEIGDLLFSCVNLARHMGVDAEQALRAANQRFEQRFAQVERGLRDQGLEPSLETREAMERHWTLAKAAERPV